MSKELIFDKVIENILSNTMLARVEEGELINKKAEIWITTSEGQEGYLNYIPYDFKGEDINGHVRNTLAKEFISIYSFSDLKRLYNNKIETENKQRASEEANKNKLENVIEELELNRFSDFTRDKIEVKFNYGIKKYYIEFSVKKDRNTGSTIQIFNTNDYNNLLYKVNYNEIALNDFKTALNELYDISKAYYVEVEKEKQEALEKELKQEQIQKAIFNLYSNIANKIIILRTGKKNFIAFENGLRYSVGSGKSGKYYNCSYGQFADLINKKDINKLSYTLLDKDAKTYQQDEFYLSLEYKNIM